MEFLNNLGINSASGLIGVVLVAIGGFMVLAGVGIISIQQVTIRQGRATWVVGAVLAVVGGFLLYPELSTPGAVPDNPEAVVVTNPTAAAATQPTATHAAAAASGMSSEWKTIEFIVPGNGLWLAEDGRYTAIGSKDTIAWSEEIFTGDLEISYDVESSHANTAANLIIYGSGGSLAPGNLIITVASDLQAILADSIYENGKYLFSSLNSLTFEGQKHSVLVSIIDRKASLFLDGEEIASVFLDEHINSGGKIGLLKYWEIDEVTFSNISVRASDIIK
ncbi:MAG: hypothetical protein E4G99_05050 [Anaerolineales bacterium]|nr:MAG: hypothetical protein E4G99_05050 [Anaerolineales bacterium]